MAYSSSTESPGSDTFAHTRPLILPNSILPPPLIIDMCILELDEVLHPKQTHIATPISLFVRTRLERMLLFLRVYRERDYKSWIEASLEAAKLVGKGEWLARCLREWCQALARHGTYPVRKELKAKTSKTENERVAGAIKAFLQQQKFASAKDVADHLNAQLDLTPIDEPTADRWIRVLGYSWKNEPKGQYTDGHEREDVIDDGQCEGKIASAEYEWLRTLDG